MSRIMVVQTSRAGVPMVEATLRLGWTVEQQLARQAVELPAAPGMGSVDERLALTAASIGSWPGA